MTNAIHTKVFYARVSEFDAEKLERFLDMLEELDIMAKSSGFWFMLEIRLFRKSSTEDRERFYGH